MYEEEHTGRGIDDDDEKRARKKERQMSRRKLEKGKI